MLDESDREEKCVHWCEEERRESTREQKKNAHTTITHSRAIRLAMLIVNGYNFSLGVFKRNQHLLQKHDSENTHTHTHYTHSLNKRSADLLYWQALRTETHTAATSNTRITRYDVQHTEGTEMHIHIHNAESVYVESVCIPIEKIVRQHAQYCNHLCVVSIICKSEWMRHTK